MPEGPFGAPRPLAACNFTIEAHGPFARGRSQERSLKYEDEVRSKLALNVDVVEQNGVMKYVIREDRININTWNEMLNMVREQTKSNDLYVGVE